MKKLDMDQCHRFIHSWKDTEPVPCTVFLKMKSLDTTYFKTAGDEANKLVLYTSDISVHLSDQSSLTYQIPTLFSKEHVIQVTSR